MDGFMAMRIFESIPEGSCKEAIRTRAEELRTLFRDNRDPRHLQVSLETAFAESVDSGKFPEVWTYIRAMTPAPWGEDDIICAFQAVGKVESLTDALATLTNKYDSLKDRHMDLLRSSHDLQNFEKVVNAAWQMQQLKGRVNLEDLD